MLKFFTTVTTLLVLASGALAQQTAEADYQDRLQKLKGMIEQLNKELKSVKGERNDLRNQLQKSETEIGELLRDIDRIKTDLKQHQTQLNDLQQRRQQLDGSRRDQQKHIAQQVNAAYRLGQQSNIKMLLNQESPERVSRMLRYYDYFINARAEKINAYLDTISELDQIQPRIQQKTDALAQNQQNLQRRHRQLSGQQQTRKRTLAKLNQTITSKDAQLRKLAEDRERLQRLLSQVAQAIANLPLPQDSQPFARTKGRLPWPTKGQIQHRFGSSRVSGKLKWDGVLIQAPAGRSVKAVHHGRVVFADYLRGQGLLLIIDHGNGYMSLYAHNQSLLREAGDWVETGETIAAVGNSGGRQQAGLYFEIRHQGKPTDPSRWLKRHS